MNKPRSLDAASILLVVFLPLLNISPPVLRLPSETSVADRGQVPSSPAVESAGKEANAPPPMDAGVVLIGLAADVTVTASAAPVQVSDESLAALLRRIGVQRMEPAFGPGTEGLPTASPDDDANVSRVYRVRLAPEADIHAAVGKLKSHPAVIYAEPDYFAHIIAVPDDPLYGQQWGLEEMQLPAAWDLGTGTQSVVIAIVDSGIDKSHPDLAGKLWVNPGEIPDNGLDDDNNGYIDDVHGWDFVNDDNDPSDDSGHGTKVAGIAAGAANNATGIAGVCWGCTVMPIKVMRASNVARYSDIAEGVLYAAHKGARIITLSLGGYTESTTLHEAIQAATGIYGAVVVAGAGNDNTAAPFYPAAYPEVLSVTGITSRDTKALFANYGDWVDVAAPGMAITTTLMGGSWGPVNGTSFAAPLVSGLAGLLVSSHPQWDAELVRAQIQHTVDPIDDENPDYRALLGCGRVNAAAAVQHTPHPMLAVSSATVNGEAHGRPAPGTVATLDVALHNEWVGATGVSGRLTTTDPYVRLEKQVAHFGDIGENGLGAADQPFTFAVATDAGHNHSIPITLELTANGGEYVATLAFTVSTCGADEPVAGVIATDAVWSADKSYVVNGDIEIAPGTQLVIEPGTTVRFNGDYVISVAGRFVASGTSDQPIRFLSQGGEGWGGIYFRDTSDDARTDARYRYVSGSALSYVQIEGARGGITCEHATPYMSHIRLIGGGISCTPGALKVGSAVWSGMMLLRDSDITGNLLVNGRARLTNNTIAGQLHVTDHALLRANTIHGTTTLNNHAVVEENTITNGNLYISAGLLVSNHARNREMFITGSPLNASQVVSNTLSGGGIKATSTAWLQGNSVENAPGWGIDGAAPVTLIANRVVGNGRGVQVAGGLVQGNLIANNRVTGLEINGDTRVISNTLTGNGDATIRILSGGAVLISDNNLEANRGPYDIENRVPRSALAEVTAAPNWWGTVDPQNVAKRIFDVTEDQGVGPVVFAPVKTGPVPGAPAYVRAVTWTPEGPVGIQQVTFEVEFSRPMKINERVEIAFHERQQAAWGVDYAGNSGEPDGAVRAIALVREGSKWRSSLRWSANAEVSALVPQGTYVITVRGVAGTDGIEIAPSSSHNLTIAYEGAMGDTTAPFAPIVLACGAAAADQLAARWSAHDPDGAVTLYRYAIGTMPGVADVVNWTDTTEPFFTRSGLKLAPGQMYYISVQARNTGGLWSEPAISRGVQAGAGACPTADFTVDKISAPASVGFQFSDASSAGVDTWLWDFGDAVTSTLQHPSHVYAAPGVYTVTLSVSGPSGGDLRIKPAYMAVLQPVSVDQPWLPVMALGW